LRIQRDGFSRTHCVVLGVGGCRDESVDCGLASVLVSGRSDGGDSLSGVGQDLSGDVRSVGNVGKLVEKLVETDGVVLNQIAEEVQE